MKALSPPELLTAHRNVGGFDSGEPSLNERLARRALANQISGASRTFVVSEDNRIVGYYALASGVVAVKAAPGRFRRTMPDPIPVVVLAHLAIDVQWQGRGVGRALFRDAALRIARAADVIGIRGIVVQAISMEAQSFYIALGFTPSPQDPMMLMVTLSDIRATLS